ncbi:Tfp pilus assembly protein FimT/FimU [soil metagenome]
MGKSIRHSWRGFTLIELLVVMAITGILIAMAMPSFTQYLALSQVSGATNAMAGSVQRTRSEAITRRAEVRMCRSLNANTAVATAVSCAAAAGGGYAANDWSAGWIIFAKAPANTGPGFQAADVLITRQPPLSTGSGGRAVLYAMDGSSEFSFQPDGIRTGFTVPTVIAVDWRTDASTYAGGVLASNRARCISLSAPGRVELTKGHAGSTC